MCQSFEWKKKFETNFIMSKALFGVAQPERNKKYLLLLLTAVLGPVNHFFYKISSIKHDSSFKIFTFATIL